MTKVKIAALVLMVMSMTLCLNCRAEESHPPSKQHLYILWTNSDPVTADKMIFMYAGNALKKGWWQSITIVIWGSTAKLAGENPDIQKKLKELIAGGVQVSACKACADAMGVTEKLKSLGIEVKYWGAPLTEIIKSGQPLLTL